MEKIRNLTAEYLTLRKEFKIVKFTTNRGREYEKFLITKKGFMKLIMNTSAKGDKIKLLYELQDNFIDAFEKMEKELIYKKLKMITWNG